MYSIPSCQHVSSVFAFQNDQISTVKGSTVKEKVNLCLASRGQHKLTCFDEQSVFFTCFTTPPMSTPHSTLLVRVAPNLLHKELHYFSFTGFSHENAVQCCAHVLNGACQGIVQGDSLAMCFFFPLPQTQVHYY